MGIPHRAPSLTAVIDIGKTKTALVLVTADGEKVLERSRACAVVGSELGYSALDTAGTEAWLKAELAGLGPIAASLRRIVVTTHGAAIAALRDGALLFPVPDYEWAGFDERPDELADAQDFAATLSPLLPCGLNVGVQLDWIERNHPRLLADADTLLPYPQYWAWWLCGVASSEVSSLGCHTLLWQPKAQSFSDWAQSRGWAQRFAPMRKAWETLGPIREELAAELNLPRGIQVHVGVHDSNACLARYLRNWPRMTLVSTGTWVVVMAPGSSAAGLDAKLDQLGNVSVRGECVPTARFMGGRELGKLCAGADPSSASAELLVTLLQRGLRFTPGFERQGGPFAARKGEIHLDGRAFTLEQWAIDVPDDERATAAALYAALVTAWIVQRLGGFGPIVVDGPFARNPVIMEVIAALLPHLDVYASDDSVDGTVLGGWSLTRWTEPAMLEVHVRREAPRRDLVGELQKTWERWAAATNASSCDIAL